MKITITRKFYIFFGGKFSMGEFPMGYEYCIYVNLSYCRFGILLYI